MADLLGREVVYAANEEGSCVYRLADGSVEKHLPFPCPCPRGIYIYEF